MAPTAARHDMPQKPAESATGDTHADLTRPPAALLDFEVFVRENATRAHRLAWRLLGGDDAAASDVVQEAFIKAHKGLHKFRGEASPDTWFFRIVVNQARSHQRKAWFSRWVGLDGEVAEQLVPNEQRNPPPSDPGLRKRIVDAVRGLSPGQRQAFVLVHLEGQTVREAAQIMRVSEGTAKKHLHRALVRLRQTLGEVNSARSGT